MDVSSMDVSSPVLMLLLGEVLLYSSERGTHALNTSLISHIIPRISDNETQRLPLGACSGAYRDTSFTRERPPIGPYRRPMLGVLRGS